MDYGHLMFDEPEAAADAALPAPDFDFYGFMPAPGDVMGNMPQQQQQQQQQQRDQQLQRQHIVPSPGTVSDGGLRSHSHGGFDVVDQDMHFSTPHAFHLGSSASSTTAAASTGSTMLPRGSASTASTTPGRLSPMPLVPGTTSPDARNLSISAPSVTGKTLVLASNNHARSHHHHQPQQQQHHHHMQGNLSGSEAASNSSHNKRLERRGHTKSRRGCFNCKRRRIKCQETRPACGHCLKTGLQCEYPVAPLVNHQPQHQIPLFSLQDMRFFQHFLLHCSPHHPLGNHSLWTHEIPCLSHSYDYLMHALLGMAASDLMRDDPSLVTAAMDHRLKAIRSIKRTLAAVPKWPNSGAAQSQPAVGERSGSGSASPHSTGEESSGKGGGARRQSGSSSGEPWDLHGGSSAPGTPMFEEGNALMATCFALTFQSVALDDGMAEYMTFIRGIIVVAIQMYLKGARIMFRNLLNNDQAELLRPAIEPMSAIDRQWSMAALTACQNLAPLCAGDSMATTYQKLVVEMAEALLVSPLEAYSAMTRHYAWWMQLPHEQFRQVIDLDKQVFVLLATHWIALKQIMARITSKEEVVSTALSRMESAEGRSAGKPVPSIEVDGVKDVDGSMDPGIFRWLKHLNRQVEPEYLAYNKWPMWVESELDRDLGAFGKQ
ncbi:c6 zinc finger domain containing protein [Sporothrix schenckii 1099-18]|uniref:Zn(2)-C6 fungal-type domain-containing protein n=2 Tax=Sporothrix schenckii TaxID=29908 RepID=U7PZZ7_SPOS1|nr:c6 zinc finger domain containing protein [Sporothrix schenckii 1099-18]ERT00036.1 hypothetical protein HMPREF1624_03405 [Sporothrix schenckii ATCC 58251]KJR85536.1 c6 zinc finger domain containing protein [Sporothrix schenckii 1099-18]